MCQVCASIVAEAYPTLSEEDQYEILISATCFPFGDPETVQAQLEELIRETDGSLDGALAFADRSLREQMEDSTNPTEAT